jgi:hypothetical protein
MVLKEAFRAQNYLEGIISEGLSFLIRTDNVTIKKQAHMRKKVNADADDEVIELPKSVEFENKAITPNVVIDFVMDVLAEKEKLTSAIAVAKVEAEMDIDSAIALNKSRQHVAAILNVMGNIKASEKQIIGRDYKFNVDGVQVPYQYNINETTTIDFDRHKVKGLVKKLSRESDDVSTKLDTLNVTVNVGYTPKYEIGDSFEDCLNTFLR